ncbi:hypothetical protein PCE1_003043 [Barthelona sp. PCE]
MPEHFTYKNGQLTAVDNSTRASNPIDEEDDVITSYGVYGTNVTASGGYTNSRHYNATYGVVTGTSMDDDDPLGIAGMYYGGGYNRGPIKPKRPSIGYLGLSNQGATCYMNSLIQTLYMTPELRTMVYNWKYVPDVHGVTESCIPFQLQRLFSRLQVSDHHSCETKDLTKSFGWTGSDVFMQHDVQELFCVLIDALERATANTPLAENLAKLYTGGMGSLIQCMSCGYRSENRTGFTSIALPIREMDMYGRSTVIPTLEEALNKYVITETLEGDNAYSCSGCNNMVRADKRMALFQLPDVMNIQLMRFDFDYQTMRRIKINERVAFPLYLDMDQWLGDSKGTTNYTTTANFKQRKEGANVYELYSVLIQSGSAMGGHYYCLTKNMDDGMWYKFNDSSVTQATEDDIETYFGGQRSHANAYMLVYRRVSSGVKLPVKDEVPETHIDEIKDEHEEALKAYERELEKRSKLTVQVYLTAQDINMVDEDCIDPEEKSNYGMTYYNTTSDDDKKQEPYPFPILDCASAPKKSYHSHSKNYRYEPIYSSKYPETASVFVKKSEYTWETMEDLVHEKFKLPIARNNFRLIEYRGQTPLRSIDPDTPLQSACYGQKMNVLMETKTDGEAFMPYKADMTKYRFTVFTPQMEPVSEFSDIPPGLGGSCSAPRWFSVPRARTTIGQILQGISEASGIPINELAVTHHGHGAITRVDEQNHNLAIMALRSVHIISGALFIVERIAPEAPSVVEKHLRILKDLMVLTWEFHPEEDCDDDAVVTHRTMVKLSDTFDDLRNTVAQTIAVDPSNVRMFLKKTIRLEEITDLTEAISDRRYSLNLVCRPGEGVRNEDGVIRLQARFLPIVDIMPGVEIEWPRYGSTENRHAYVEEGCTMDEAKLALLEAFEFDLEKYDIPIEKVRIRKMFYGTARSVITEVKDMLHAEVGVEVLPFSDAVKVNPTDVSCQFHVIDEEGKEVLAAGTIVVPLHVRVGQFKEKVCARLGLENFKPEDLNVAVTYSTLVTTSTFSNATWTYYDKSDEHKMVMSPFSLRDGQKYIIKLKSTVIQRKTYSYYSGRTGGTSSSTYVSSYSSSYRTRERGLKIHVANDLSISPKAEEGEVEETGSSPDNQ